MKEGKYWEAEKEKICIIDYVGTWENSRSTLEKCRECKMEGEFGKRQ